MDIEKDFEVTMLYELYRPMLTEKQQSVLDMYYNLDYSLAEIAANEGISRQAALDTIKKGTEKLYKAEEGLMLYARYQKTAALLEQLEQEAQKMPEPQRKIVLAYIGRARLVWEEE